jgi:hypothetical protein
MYAGRDFSPQETQESEPIGLDFVNDLDDGEFLMSSVWDMAAVSGLDLTPELRLEGPSIVIEPEGSNDKTATVQRVGNLVPGVTYRVRATVITTYGNTRSLWSHIRGVAANS